MCRVNRTTTFAAVALATLAASAASAASAQQAPSPYGALNSSAFTSTSAPLDFPSLAISPEMPVSAFDATDAPPGTQRPVDVEPRTPWAEHETEETNAAIPALDVAAKRSTPTVMTTEPSAVLDLSDVTNAPAEAPVPIDREAIGRLIAKARQAIQLGQITQARAFLEIAASLHIPDATFMLAQTYDPEILSRWGAVGLSGDPDMAARYYREAAKDTPLHEPQRLRPQDSSPSPRLASQFAR